MADDNRHHRATSVSLAVDYCRVIGVKPSLVKLLTTADIISDYVFFNEVPSDDEAAPNELLSRDPLYLALHNTLEELRREHESRPPEHRRLFLEAAMDGIEQTAAVLFPQQWPAQDQPETES